MTVSPFQGELEQKSSTGAVSHSAHPVWPRCQDRARADRLYYSPTKAKHIGCVGSFQMIS